MLNVNQNNDPIVNSINLAISKGEITNLSNKLDYAIEYEARRVNDISYRNILELILLCIPYYMIKHRIRPDAYGYFCIKTMDGNHIVPLRAMFIENDYMIKIGIEQKYSTKSQPIKSTNQITQEVLSTINSIPKYSYLDIIFYITGIQLLLWYFFNIQNNRDQTFDRLKKELNISTKNSQVLGI